MDEESIGLISAIASVIVVITVMVAIPCLFLIFITVPRAITVVQGS